MRSTDNIDRQEIEFMMKFFDLDEITVRDAYEKAHNNCSKVMDILGRKSEEKNN